MKKVLVVMMALIISVGMIACGSSSSGGTDAKEDSEAEEEVSEDNESEEAQESEEEAEPETEDVAWELGEVRTNVWTNSIDTKWIQIIVPVTNTGTKNLYIESAKVDLEDSTGHLVDSLDYISGYPQVLLPGETGYYYEETTLEGVEETEFTALPHVSVEEARIDCIRMEVSDLDIRDEGYGDIQVTGRIENTTDEEQDSIYIIAFLYGEDGSLLGEALDITMDALAPGDKVGFSATTFSIPDSVTVSSIANYEVFAFPYQFQF